MDAVYTLFGGPLRIKLIRLFIFNPDVGFSPNDLSVRSEGSLKAVKKELSLLQRSGLVKKKPVYVGEGKKRRAITGYVLNSSFPYLDSFHTFFLDTTRLGEKRLLDIFSRVGKVKYIVIAGAFMKQWDSRVDLLIVGDEVQEKLLLRTLRTVEADMGREIRFALLQTSDFMYRISVYDRLLRDVLDFPHKIILDKIGVTPPKPIRLLSTLQEGAS